MNILCTGSEGFIARHLINRLERHKDVMVRGFDKANGQDLRNLKQVKEAVKGADAVFHLAAVADLDWARKNPVETMEVNVQGTWNVAMACLEAKATLYYASTCCVYGNQKVHPETEESIPNPSEIYAGTKMAGENVIMGLHHSFGLQYNMMRFATIYGPGARGALATHIFLKQALRGEPITVHGDGLQTRTLTYVEDLVDGIEALWKSGKMNGKWNLSTEESVSALKMAQDIKRITGSKSEITHVSQRIGQTFVEEISAKKMLKETGWRAKTSWEEGIEKMREWFVKEGLAG